MTRELQPQVIVMDIAMPLMNGLEATRPDSQSFSRRQSTHLIRAQRC